MWRAFFLSLGIYGCLLGIECLTVDRAVLAPREVTVEGMVGRPNSVMQRREIQPPDWAPWSLLSVGAVTILYSFTIPQRTQQP